MMHKTEPVSPTVKRIVSIGTDPWQVRELNGTVRFKRADAAQLKVTALDFNGYPIGPAGTVQEIKLQPTTTLLRHRAIADTQVSNSEFLEVEVASPNAEVFGDAAHHWNATRA